MFIFKKKVFRTFKNRTYMQLKCQRIGGDIKAQYVYAFDQDHVKKMAVNIYWLYGAKNYSWVDRFAFFIAFIEVFHSNVFSDQLFMLAEKLCLFCSFEKKLNKTIYLSVLTENIKPVLFYLLSIIWFSEVGY